MWPAVVEFIPPDMFDRADHARIGLFLRLLTQNSKHLHRVVTRFVINQSDVDDVLQEVYVSLWLNFDEQAPEGTFKVWAGKIATSRAIDYLRSQRTKNNRLVLSEEAVNSLAQTQNSADEYLELRLEILDECINQLPEEQPNLVSDVYLNSLKAEELSQKYQKPVRTIYFTISKIREALHTCINRKLGRV